MSQKLENILNLALDATQEERERSDELEVGYDPPQRKWELIIKYSGALDEVRKIAEEFEAVFVPLQTCFDQVRENRDEKYWIWDGVHPTENGHGLIARQWLRCTGKMLGVEDFEKRLL